MRIKSSAVFSLSYFQRVGFQAALCDPMHRKRQLIFKPVKPHVNALWFSLSVGEDGTLRHRRYLTSSGHQGHGTALDTGPETDNMDWFTHFFVFSYAGF